MPYIKRTLEKSIMEINRDDSCLLLVGPRQVGKCLLHYYRDKDTNEIDMVIETDGELHPLEIKKSSNPGTELVSAFKVLDKGSVPRGAV